jgi:hypothetical protein
MIPPIDVAVQGSRGSAAASHPRLDSGRKRITISIDPCATVSCSALVLVQAPTRPTPLGAVERRSKPHDPQANHRLETVPSVGRILALTILYEIHDIKRIERVQDLLSYTRLVKCDDSSAGKKLGTGGAEIGNVHLKWAFSEAAVLFLRCNPEGQKQLCRLAGRHGKAKALSILAAKLGRAVYLMLSKDRVFDMERFLAHNN